MLGCSGSPRVETIVVNSNQVLGVFSAVSDLNGDGVVSVVDVQILVNAALGGGCNR
jgi:hypothetical protein